MQICVDSAVAMDAKDLRTESALSTRNNDGTKYSQGGAPLQGHRNKQYQDNSSNSLGKVDVPPARPCAVIGPDRVVPPPVTTDTYLKKAPVEPWLSKENTYRRPPDYPHKLADYQHPSRNISPRQTFQENMQRIMVPPSYNSAKLKEDHNFPVDANMSPMRNNKSNVPPEAKYCEVPYTVNPMTTEQKNVRSADISVSNMNPVLSRSAHGWPSPGANVRPAKPYGAHPELYQYPDYPSCAGPRPMLISRPHRTIHEEPGPVYSDPYYHERFKPYPSVKERYPQPRYEYINYSTPFHPPPAFTTHKYDPQKPMPPNLYPGYGHVPFKYLDPRMAEHVINGYQRPPNQQGNFNNVQFRNQVIQSTYGPVPGNCLQNKFYPYPTEGPVKPQTNKPAYDTNNKMYVEYENARPKNYSTTENFYVNEMGRHPMKGPVISPNYAPVNMHPLPPHPYYRKENPNSLMKNYEYSPHFRNVDSSINMPRLQTQYSLNSFAISPSDSNTSNDANQTHGTSQEDCGYVSQSSTASIRSIDSGIYRMPNDPYRRYDYRYGPMARISHLPKSELNANRSDGSKDKKDIDVRQFFQMWNEGDDESGDNNNKVTAKAVSNNVNDMAKQYEANSQEQLYVLGLVNVPSEELDKYEHIQKVSKLPENIKGYNNIELLNQFEEVIESSNLNNYHLKPPIARDFQVLTKSSMSMQGLGILPRIPRPVSPLDVEAKISQSVIHKEVGCNFEIKPCSPKMLNVEIAAPIQTVLGERLIEKVSNPLNIGSPMSHHMENNSDNMSNVIKHQDRRVPLIDNSKVNSCTMINTEFSGDNVVDPVKGNNYTLQDLESNAGICLASLPRLDNECELNFPEVNQQFINANKVESVITPTPTPFKDLPTLDIDHCDTAIKDPDGQETENCMFSPSEGGKDFHLGKEHTKLSKFRKIKRKAPENNDDDKVFNHQVIRTDSVIIKNPDNIKSNEDIIKNSSPLNILTENVLLSPINLSVNTEARAENKDADTKYNELVKNKPSEFAIDFSLNSNESEKIGSYKKIAFDENDVNVNVDTNSYKTFDVKCHTAGVRKENYNGSCIPLKSNLDYKNNIQHNMNTDADESCENNMKNYLIPEDPKEVYDVSANNIFTETISESHNVNNPVIVENESESDEMSKLLCETASNSVHLEPKTLDVENKKGHDLNVEKSCVNSCCEKDGSANEDLMELDRRDLDRSMKSTADPTIDHPIKKYHHNGHEHSTAKECEKNDKSSDSQPHNVFTFDTTGTLKVLKSPEKEAEQTGGSKSDEIELNSTTAEGFYDDMDVEHQMESLFSEKARGTNGKTSSEKIMCAEDTNIKSDIYTQEKLDDFHLCESNTLNDVEKSDNGDIKNNARISEKEEKPAEKRTTSELTGVEETKVEPEIYTHKTGKPTDVHSREPNAIQFAINSKTEDVNYDADTPEKASICSRSKSCVSKELFSPWIQKLIMKVEGFCQSTLNNVINMNTENTEIKSENIGLPKRSIKDSSSDTSSDSDKLPEHETYDLCNDLLSDIEEKNCFNESNDSSTQFMHTIIISDATNEPTLDQIKISSNVHESYLKCEPILSKETINPPPYNELFNTVASGESKSSPECLSTDIIPATSKIHANPHVVEPNSIEVKNSTLVEIFSKSENSSSAEDSGCKPIMPDLNSDCVKEATVDDNTCTSNVDKPLTGFCLDEKKIGGSIADETRNSQPLHCDDATKFFQLEIEKDKRIQIYHQSDENYHDDSALKRNNSDSSSFEDDGGQENISNELSNSEVYVSTLEKTKNTDFSTSESTETSESNETLIETIVDTQNKSESENSDGKTNPVLDSDLSLTPPICNKREIDFCNIPENEVFDSVTDETETIIAQNLTKSKNLIDKNVNTSIDLVNDPANERSPEAEDYILRIESNDEITNNEKRKYINEVTATRKFNVCENSVFLKKRTLKRSYSESALDKYSLSRREHSNVDDINSTNPFVMQNKRKKHLNTENHIEHDCTSENYCNVINNNRRNSIATICEQNVSFCILIDDNCIITEDEEESEKNCFTEISQEVLPCIENTMTDDDERNTDNVTEFITLQEEVTSEHSNAFGESWVDDVACVETVVSDDIAEDIVISASASPRDEDSLDYESNNDESGIFSLNEHTDKLKYIYGDKMCSDDAQLVETLYRTPQMDVNKTLVHRESMVLDDQRYYDVESLERVLSESNNCELKSYESNSIVEFTSSLCPSGFVASDKTPDDDENVDLDNFDDNSLPFGIKNIDCNMTSNMPEAKFVNSPKLHRKSNDNVANSRESSIDDVFSYNLPEYSPNYVISSSSEVSSTTSEDKNSNLYLKITKYKDSISQGNNYNFASSISCKYTEKEDCLYSNSKLPSRPLITKAAQKYIPPLKDTIPNLKVKLPLPQNSLKKLKQLKVSKEEPKPKLNVHKHDVVNVLRNTIPKKPKPKFEDVLKSIDEIQFKKHKEKSKKPKKVIPKVVIKKNENGSHYASTLNKDKFNPDLTGRKWQPWVFLEKNNFIDKMALKRKTKAIYSHRKNSYVLAEKFQKYKSISSTKFVISQPKINQLSPGQLKYTIRLKHSL